MASTCRRILSSFTPLLAYAVVSCAWLQPPSPPPANGPSTKPTPVEEPTPPAGDPKPTPPDSGKSGGESNDGDQSTGPAQESEPNDSASEADSIVVNGSIRGKIGDTGDPADWFTFIADVDGQVHAKLTNRLTTGLGKVGLEVYDSNSKQITFLHQMGANGSKATPTWYAVKGRPYRVKVIAGASLVAPYQVEVMLQPD